jgi:hypothetical protein
MYWMQVDNRPEETKLELESMGDADELITHASFAAEKSAYTLNPPSVAVQTQPANRATQSTWIWPW